MFEKAVIDRIVDGQTAVIIVGAGETQHHYPADKLPEGAKEGSWLKVQIESGEITSVEINNQETDLVRKRIQSKMERLRARGRKKPPQLQGEK